MPIDPIFGRFEFNPLYPTTQYIYILCILFIGFLIVRTIVYSPFGESLTGIRENTLRMHAVGAPVRKRLVICYAISAAIAGVAGAIWAQSNAYVNMSTLSLDRAATVLIILVLGGYGRLYGAFRRRGRLYGAVALSRETLSDGMATRAWPDADDHRAVRAQRDHRHFRISDGAAARKAGVMSETLLEARGVSKRFGALRRRATSISVSVLVRGMR